MRIFPLAAKFGARIPRRDCIKLSDLSLCYKIYMSKIVERWLLFKYIAGEFTPLSKPLKKKEQAEKARLKYSERERKAFGIGVIRTKG